MLVNSLRHLLSVALVSFALYLSGLSGFFSRSETGESGPLRYIVVGWMFLGAVCFILHAFLDRIDRRLIPVFIAGGVMVLTQAVAFILSGMYSPIDNNRFIETVIQQMLVVSWIGFGTIVDWRGPVIWFSAFVSGVLILGANLVVWRASDFQIPFDGLSTSKNGLAAAACCGVLIAVYMHLYWRNAMSSFAALFLGGISWITLLASGGRASILFLAMALGIYFLWPLFRHSRLGAFWLTIGMVVILTSIPVLYVNLDRFSWFQELDAEMAKLTHSTYSGRETLWPEVIGGISEHPVLGNGTSVPWRFVRKEYGIVNELSAHNLYLAILFQSGIVGLSGLVIFFSMTLHAYWSMPDSRWVRISFAIFVAALFREVWDVSLTQNTLQIGLGTWVLATMGLSIGSQIDDDDDQHETESIVHSDESEYDE